MALKFPVDPPKIGYKVDINGEIFEFFGEFRDMPIWGKRDPITKKPLAIVGADQTAAGGGGSAGDVDYTNPSVPSISNAGEALDDLYLNTSGLLQYVVSVDADVTLTEEESRNSVWWLQDPGEILTDDICFFVPNTVPANNVTIINNTQQKICVMFESGGLNQYDLYPNEQKSISFLYPISVELTSTHRYANGSYPYSFESDANQVLDSTIREFQYISFLDYDLLLTAKRNISFSAALFEPSTSIQILHNQTKGGVIGLNIDQAGTGYQPGDTFGLTPLDNQNPGSGLTIEVLTVDGLGAVTDWSIETAGADFIIGETVFTLGGSGTGLRFTIDDVGLGQEINVAIYGTSYDIPAGEWIALANNGLGSVIVFDSNTANGGGGSVVTVDALDGSYTLGTDPGSHVIVEMDGSTVTVPDASGFNEGDVYEVVNTAGETAGFTEVIYINGAGIAAYSSVRIMNSDTKSGSAGIYIAAPRAVFQVVNGAWVISGDLEPDPI